MPMLIRRAITATLAVLALTAGIAPASVRPDWIVVGVDIGPEGAWDLKIEVSALAIPSGGEAAIGFGLADAWGRHVDVAPAGAGTWRVTSTGDTGAIDVRLIPTGGPGSVLVHSELRFDGYVPAGSRINMLVFTPGFGLENLVISPPEVNRGSAATIDWQGAGSTALSAAHRDDGGTGAAAGPAAIAAGATHDMISDEGIVGGFVTSSFCVVCSGSWESPGDQGSFTSASGVAAGQTNGSAAFAGMPGAWRLRWSGVGATTSGRLAGPVYAAYAPVGDLWALFLPFGF